MTNGDLIRTMSDEEMAIYIEHYLSVCEPDKRLTSTCEIFSHTGEFDPLEWLKQEAQDGKPRLP